MENIFGIKMTACIRVLTGEPIRNSFSRTYKVFRQPSNVLLCLPYPLYIYKMLLFVMVKPIYSLENIEMCFTGTFAYYGIVVVAGIFLCVECGASL